LLTDDSYQFNASLKIFKQLLEELYTYHESKSNVNFDAPDEADQKEEIPVKISQHTPITSQIQTTNQKSNTDLQSKTTETHGAE